MMKEWMMKEKWFFVLLIMGGILFAEQMVAQQTKGAFKGKEKDVTNSSKWLRIKSKYLSYGKDEVIYEPDNDVKKAAYEKYYFTRKEFDQALSESAYRSKAKGHQKKPSKSGEFSLLLQNCQESAKNYIPEDEKMQAPIGGFHNKTYRCKIVNAKN